MRVTCEGCQTNYNIADDKLPAQKAKAACKKCGGVIVIDPAAKAAETPADTRVTPPAAMLADYPELAGPDFAACGLTEIILPDKKGRFKNSRNKLKVKLLAAVAPLFGKMLATGEEVHRIGYGIAHYPLEIFFGNGFLTMYSNYYAIVATDRRLLFININSGMKKTTHMFFQLPYDQIKKAEFGSIFSRITLTPVTGKRRTFTGIKRYLAKELKEYIKGKLATVTPIAEAEAQALDLCPGCYQSTAKGVAECPSCGVGFKKPAAAFWRSLVLPGWGDIYLGHKVLGSIELLGSLVVWAFIIPLLMSGDPLNYLVAAVILVLVNLFDGVLTYFMGQKGYILA
jgi:predicted Zn finger-like uncharacterized protein